jgi:hypothetical protein
MVALRDTPVLYNRGMIISMDTLVQWRLIP